MFAKVDWEPDTLRGVESGFVEKAGDVAARESEVMGPGFSAMGEVGMVVTFLPPGCVPLLLQDLVLA